MTARRGQLQRRPRLLLARPRRRGPAARARRRAAASTPGPGRRSPERSRAARVGRDEVGEVAHGVHADARAPAAASAALATGTTTSRHPARAAASTAGSTPRTWRIEPSSPSSPRWTTSRDPVGGHQAEGGEHRDGDGQVEPAAVLGDRGRRQVDRDPVLGERPADAGRGSLDPVGRLGAGRVGQPAEHERRQPAGQVRLDLDHRARPAPPGSPSACAPKVTPPTPCEVPHHGRPSTGRRMPIDVDPDPAGVLVVGLQPGRREPPQPRGLAPVHRLDRVAEPLGRGGS